MADYIKREALLEAIDKAFDESPVEDTTAWMLGRRIIRKFPAADVQEIKHGEWEEFNGIFLCTNCNDYSTSMTAYCVNCGAEMRLKRKEIDE